MTVPMKVGTLARQTGLSVRTLHYYDEIGLLHPSARTPTGHLLDDASDVQRLQQIQSLRATGFPLDEIRRLLASAQISAQRVIELHLERLQMQIVEQQRLAVRLQNLSRLIHSETTAPLAELCRIIEATIMMETYFTPAQLQTMQQQGEALGPDRIREVEQAWAEVIPAVREHMAKGTSPDDPALQALGVRWRELVNAFSGGNRDIAANARAMYQEQHTAINAANPNTPNPEMFAFMGKVFATIAGGPG
jgi:DNA-binding transcriptional MerR regulator